MESVLFKLEDIPLQPILCFYQYFLFDSIQWIDKPEFAKPQQDDHKKKRTDTDIWWFSNKA